MTYANETNKIVQNRIVNRDEIFNYLETPLEVHCDGIFLYYKKLIENNSDLYKIDPNFFFYNNKTTVNARAIIKGDNTIISINIGTINELKKTFLDNEELTDEIFGEPIQKLNEILIKKGSSIMNFMYNSAIVFLINHEIGHLIQNNEESDKNLNEAIEVKEEFNIENHIYEVDSDIFASMKLIQDIHQIWENFDSEYKTDGFLCDLISLAASAIGIFKLFNLNAQNKIYYNEKSHPHVAIRYIIIQEIMVDYISHIRGSKISERFKNSIMSNSLALIDILNKFKKDTFFKNFSNICNQNSNKITEYSAFLINEVSQNMRCAYCKMKKLEE